MSSFAAGDDNFAGTVTTSLDSDPMSSEVEVEAERRFNQLRYAENGIGVAIGAC